MHLEGRRSNRSALGARVTLHSGGRSQTDEIRGGGSYLSQSDLRLHFGLGGAAIVERIEIAWPSGARQTLTAVDADRVLTVREPEP